MKQKSLVTQEEIAQTIISELLETWPRTAVLFQKRNMACLGCVVAPFYTIDDAITIYGLNREKFLNELAQLINN